MKVTLLWLFCIFQLLDIHCQSYSVSGYIEDSKTGERLIGAMIFDSLSQNGNISNSYGYFTLKCSNKTISLITSFVGYETYRKAFSLDGDTDIVILLQPRIYSLGEVVVDDKMRLLQSSRMSTTILPVSTIKQVPMLMGETDVLKVLQSLPGVQTGTEGSSGLYVRGGGPDQNLILLDGVTVYNPDHLFGFISIFNPDAIKNVTLITGGFPAQYGGRLSSVVDIRMKEGNNKEFHGEGTLGIISSKITLEGPLGNSNTSFLISGRRSWVDLVTRTLLKRKELPYYYFYDLTAKINHTFSDRSRLYLSVYTGKDHISSIKTHGEFINDKIKYTSDMNQYYGWGNITAALRWNYILNSRLFSNSSLTYSNYKYLDYKIMNNTQLNQVDGTIKHYDYKSDFFSGITDLSLKIDFDYQPLKGHSVKFGFGSIYHIFTPMSLISLVSAESDSTLNANKKITQTGLEPSFYIEDEIQLSSRLKVNTGLRVSAFLVKNRFYGSMEPRFSGRYLLNDHIAIKFAYSRMKQYIHLLTSSRITFPTDLWVPVTDEVGPQLSDQVAIGTIHNFSDNFELSMETYYKSMKELIEYSEGSSFLEGGSWENKIEKGGIGRAYGLEFMLKKSTGKTTGWISYTLSKTERRFRNINSGNWFPYKYDRRHDISIILNQKLNDKIDAGASWEFTSGNLFTLVTDVYDAYRIIGPQTDVQYFQSRNNYRLPAYHRLDLGINFHKQKKIVYRTWSLSVYNVYNRKNVFFVYFGNDDLHGKKDLLVFKKYTLFPILPSVTYSLKF